VASCSCPEGGVTNSYCPEDAVTDAEGEGVVGYTPSVCAVVEDGVGTTGELHSGGGNDADEEEGESSPA
jgi:hypothetical protein